MEYDTPVTLLAVLDGVQVWELFAVGLLAGLLGGLMGIGGGVVIIPALVLILHEPFGPGSFHVFKLAAIVTTIVLSVPSAVRHARGAGVVPAMVAGMLPLAAIAAVASVGLSTLFVQENTYILRRLFGLFLLGLAGFNEYQTRRSAFNTTSATELDAIRRGFNLRSRSPVASRGWLFGLIVGLPAGLLAGLLGVGGGVWVVPGQHVVLGVRMRYAIGNSAIVVLFLATVTATAQSLALGRIPGVTSSDGLWLAAFLAPGALLGGWFGAGLSQRVPRAPLRRGFYVLLAIVGVRLLLF